MGRSRRWSSSGNSGALPVKIIFDASALLAILRNEPGTDVALAHLGNAAMTTVNLCEVATKLIAGGDQLAATITKIGAFGLEVLPVNIDLCWRAAVLRLATKPFGLSLGDRICIALAERENCPVLTGDRNWAVAGLKIPVVLIR